MTSKISSLTLFILILVSSFIYLPSFAQRDLGNEWIKYDQDYYKIKIYANGIYRLNYNELSGAGIPLGSIDPHNFQLFFRGREVPVFVAGEADNFFDPQDFIEFYGQKNDGSLDTVLYTNPKDHPNPYVSIYTDTAVYYLTIGTGPGLRMQTRQTPGSVNFTPAPWFTAEVVQAWGEEYHDGTFLSPNDFFGSAEYNEGEGVMSKLILPNNYKEAGLNSPSFAKGAQKAELEFNLYGKFNSYTSGADHNLAVEAGPATSSLRSVYTETYLGARRIQKTVQLDDNDVGAQTFVRVKSVGGTVTNLHAVAWVKLKYPRNFVFDASMPEGFNYRNPDADTYTHFKISGQGFATEPVMYLYDLTNGHRVKGAYITGALSFETPNNGSSSKYFISGEAQIKPANIASKITFRNLNPANDYNYLIVTHASLLNAVNDFAAYKATKEIDSGENFKPQVVTTDELYDQFFYGIHHPAAIQNYAAYMYNFSSAKPGYLFLVGKGWEPDYLKNHRSEDLVPTLGIPSSDLMFTSGIENGFQGYDNNITPNIIVGRLSARSGQEVYNYLNKLKEYDAAPPALWQKDFIHVGGGGDDINLRAKAKEVLGKAEKTIEGPYSGGNVTTFLAENADIVFENLKEAIQARIEDGAAMLTFFAHGSPNVLGVNIGDFEELDNKGRYPVMYFNGCNVGNIGYDQSLADKYILSANKGAIAWLAHSSLSYSNVLEGQVTNLYNVMAANDRFSTIGSAWKQVISNMKAQHGDKYYRPLFYHWIIQGDPSVKFSFERPADYVIEKEDLYVFPELTSAQDDSFAVAVAVGNLGNTNKDSFSISIKHTLPNNTSTTYYFKSPYVLYKDTIYCYIKNANRRLQGLNIFEVHVDHDSAIVEMSDDNNKASLEFYMPGTGVRTLFPTDFNIVSTDKPTLTVQSRDLFDLDAEAFFELDTTPYFNSPFAKKSAPIRGQTLLQWQPQLLPTDTTVYYWRARLNLPEDSGGFWEVKSFTYIKGSPEGWSQSHFPQYSGIQTDQVIMDTLARKFTFLQGVVPLVLNTTGHFYAGTGIFDGKQQGACVAGKSTVFFIEYQSKDGQPVDPHTKICINAPSLYREFNLRDAKDRDSFVKYIDLVKDGNYVALVSRWAFQGWRDWEEDVYQAFDKIGSKKIRTALNRDSIGFVIAGIKHETTGELLGESFVYDSTYDYDPPVNGKSPDVAEVEVNIKYWQNKSGSIESIKIGPAKKWHKLYQMYDAIETPDYDDFKLELIGTDKQGEDTVLLKGITGGFEDISWIDADNIRFLRLRAHLTDTGARTPPQLHLWQVIYDDIPEGTLVVDDDYLFESDTLGQAEKIKIQVRYTNISPVKMEKVPVRIFIQNSANKVVYTDDFEYPALAGGESVLISKVISAQNLEAANRLVVFVNPDRAEPEQTLDNNYLRISFYVETDKVNPVLDVTFDGRYLENGEIIRPDPEILITLTDNSVVYEPLDSSAFTISLIKPNSIKAERIYFSSNELEFIPTDSDNVTQAIFKPHLEKDGNYKLIVQATDASGNKAGTRAYEINFRIIKEAQVSNFYLYPNPVNGNARFAYTLTGEKLPDQVTFVISDASGRMVADLSNALKRSMRIGYNEFYWEGTDQHGASLGSGVYIYRVIMRNSGADLKKYTLPEDAGLEDTYGKFIIIRD